MTTSGIAKIRSQVSVLGRFQSIASAGVPSGPRMEMIIKGARQRCPDSADRLQVDDPGPHESLHAAEVAQQRAPLRRTEPRDGFQHGFVVPPRAPLAMSADGEAMRLVANALYDAQRRRVRARRDRRRLAMHEQALLPRLAIRSLRHAYQL